MFHCTTVYNYVRNQDRVIEQNGKTERKRASEQMFMRGHICVCLMCVCVCALYLFACGKLDDSMFVTAVALHRFGVALQMDVSQMLQ